MFEESLEGRRVLVTGGAGAIGRSTVDRLRRGGAQVVSVDISAPADAGHHEVDLLHEDGPGHAVHLAIRALGGLDAVVNAAGALRDAPFAQVDPTLLQAMLDIHVAMPVRLLQAAWPHLVESGSGRVVLMTSGAGLWGNPGQLAYATAKMGLVGLARTLDLEGAAQGIAVNLVAPVARSAMTASVMPERMLLRLDPAPVAAVCSYLCSARCQLRRSILEVSNGRIARTWIVSSPSARLHPADLSMDEVDSALAGLEAPTATTIPNDLAEVMLDVLRGTIPAKEGPSC